MTSATPPSPQVSRVKPPGYRMTRRLSPTELDQVAELYRMGRSTYELAHQFKTDRHTITRHLRHSGVELRCRQKMTPQLVDQAKRLYADGHSLAVIGKQLCVSPTTVGTVLKKAGVRLRDTHGGQT